MNYFPDKDKMIPEDFKSKEAYLPPKVASEEVVKIVSPPPPLVDIDRENRIVALNAAVLLASTKRDFNSTRNIIREAKEFESYLKGE